MSSSANESNMAFTTDNNTKVASTTGINETAPITMKREQTESNDFIPAGGKQRRNKSGRTSSWHAFKRLTASENPEMSSADQLIQAKKNYIPASGKQPSTRSIHRMAWRIRNPANDSTGHALNRLIRADMIARI